MHLFLPWRRTLGKLVIGCVKPKQVALKRIAELYGENVVVLRAGKGSLLSAVQRLFRDRLVHDAVFRLDENARQFSARQVATDLQLAALAIGLCAIAAIWAFVPRGGIALAVLLAAVYLANIVFRLLLFCLAWSPARTGVAVSARELGSLSNEDLPVYSVLVPLRDEARILPQLSAALANLDYPPAQLDVKIVLEEDDATTWAAARALHLESKFEIIRVPVSEPRTKPKAANFALRFARGEFVVIYDAEDLPERDQLKKSVAAFRALPLHVACLQARLNFYNRDGWLTRLFALEYAAWFDYLLPGLARLGVPIPLGGTSNHFRTGVLRALCAWDAFNVTEDADLGLRLARCGYRVMPLDSSTYEEAPCTFGSWFKQRSRWLKGYMQTLLVHLREPRAFIRAIGVARYAGVVLFVGGAVLTNLLAPLAWLASLFWLMGAGAHHPAISPFLVAATTSLLIGNLVLTALAMLSPLKRGWLGLAPYGAAAVFYSFLISLAAYRAAWEFVRRRFHWEKTEHGLACGPNAAVCRERPARRLLKPILLATLVPVLVLSPAEGNPWLKAPQTGEAILNLMLARTSAGFAPAGRAANAASDLHVEYGLQQNLTFVADSDVTYDKPGAVSPNSQTRFDTAWFGGRMRLAQWQTSVLSFEGSGGMAGLYNTDWPSRKLSLNGVAQARILFGDGFDVFDRHAFASLEGGWRWRGGAAADEATFDATLGLAPTQNTLVMLQSFSAMSTDSARPPYKRYDMHKLQLSAADNVLGTLWVQIGLIQTVAGTEAGKGGAMLALWWRF